MSYGGIQPLKSHSDQFEFFVDVDQDGTISNGDIEYVSSDFIDVPAQEILQLLVRHTPDFSDSSEAPAERYGRRWTQGTLSLVEKNRMRSSSFAIRTWELADGETVDKEAWFETTAYRENEDNEWSQYRQYNLELDPESNVNLIRNYPDFKKGTRIFQNTQLW
jgi:hypothetical protein